MQIEFRQVDYSIGGTPVLHNISFSVEQGENFVLLGPSGSGKTTILRLLLGLIVPDRGEILVDGTDITQLKIDTVNHFRKRMAVVFQLGALFDSLTVRENVGYRLFEEGWLPRDEIEQAIDQALCFVGMPEAKEKMPWELSGGMKKRAALARALASGAETILFDEPTAGLDPINAKKITSFISRLKEEKKLTSVVVTHDLEHTFAVASRIALIQQGEIIFVGTAEMMRQSTDNRVISFVSPSEGDLVSCDVGVIMGISEKRRERLR